MIVPMMARSSPKPCETALRISSKTRLPSRYRVMSCSMPAFIRTLQTEKPIKLFWMSTRDKLFRSPFLMCSATARPPTSPRRQSFIRSVRKERHSLTAVMRAHIPSGPIVWCERLSSSRQQRGLRSSCATSNTPDGPREAQERSSSRTPASFVPPSSSRKVTITRSSRSPNVSPGPGLMARRSLPSWSLTMASADGLTWWKRHVSTYLLSMASSSRSWRVRKSPLVMPGQEPSRDRVQVGNDDGGTRRTSSECGGSVLSKAAVVKIHADHVQAITQQHRGDRFAHMTPSKVDCGPRCRSHLAMKF
mmetsp:Transcript_9979/g.22296  ORF Transcript_9979/g.22296 Transcript_9979/m.22296 type:complete len:305 (-) Transcript_9979:81-995(-)